MVEFKKGESVNGWIFIVEIKGRKYYDITRDRTRKNRTGIFICPRCKKEKEQQFGNVTGRSPATNCNSCKIAKNNLKHGLKGTIDYALWKAIKTRCYNEKSTGYKNWGGRGIIVSPEFKNEPEIFVNYIKQLPNYDFNRSGHKGVTLDRINNDGNYERGNLRWVTMKVQNNNKRKKDV